MQICMAHIVRIIFDDFASMPTANSHASKEAIGFAPCFVEAMLEQTKSGVLKIGPCA